MSMPKPVGMPGGSVTRNGSPASNGIGRRRGRIGITFGAIADQSRSGGRPPIAAQHRLGRRRLDAVAQVDRPVVLAGLAPALGSSPFSIVHGHAC